MRSSRITWVVVLVLVLLCSLLASAPARMLSLVLPGEQVLMSGLAGTLWQGSASRCLLRLPQGYLHLGAVKWSLQPLSLLTLAPRLTLSSEWGSQSISGELALRGSRDIDIVELDGRIDADLLRQFAPVALAGSFFLQLARLQMRDGLPYGGEGRVVWQDGSWQSPRGPVQLGTYALDFNQPPGEALLGEVLTLAGPLEAEGRLQLEGRKYSLDILVSSPERLDEQLQQALSLMAAPEAGGFRIALAGDL